MQRGKSLFWAYLFTFLFGWFGFHLFYLEKYRGGFIYLLLSWTTIPFFLSLIDLFYVKRWTDELNAELFLQYESGSSRQAFRPAQIVRNDWGKSSRKRKHDPTLVIAEIDRMSGFEFEDFLEKLYKRHGYHVTVTPKSGDYGADLIINKDGVKIAIQAKRYKGNVGLDAVNQVHAAVAYYEADHGMVVTNSEFTPQAQKLAKRTNVELVEREDLIQLVSSLENRHIKEKRLRERQFKEARVQQRPLYREDISPMNPVVERFLAAMSELVEELVKKVREKSRR